MIKSNYKESINKKGVYTLKKNGEKITYKAWIGDKLSFLYDYFMKKSVFPNKLDASIEKHKEFLKDKLEKINKKKILEISTGSGNLSEILDPENEYIGIDISPGLLSIANKRFKENGFKNYKLYVCSAENLVFKDNLFDICICNLSLNFFKNLDAFVKDLNKVLQKGGEFLCTVPVPERNKKKRKISGELRTEKELKDIFKKHNFSFSSFDIKNGSILYFKAVLKS